MPTHLEDDSLGTLFGRLTEDGKAYARAELAYYKALAGERGSVAGIGAAYGIGAALLGLAALITLLVGLVMTLATLVGPGWATLIVVVATLLLAGVLGLMARAKFRRAFAPPPASVPVVRR